MSQSGMLRVSQGVLPPVVPTSFVTDSGTAVPAANIIDLYAQTGLADSGKTVKFTATGNQIDFHVNDANDNMAMGRAAGISATFSGVQNTGFGVGVFQNVSSGTNNCAFGYIALNKVVSSQACTAVGYDALGSVSINSLNTAVGYRALALCLGGNNTAIGAQALAGISTGTGSNNIGIGYNGGANYSGSEASNIMLGNAGVLGESNVMRLGTPGSQIQTYIAGVLNTLSGRVRSTTIPGAYPYTTLFTDDTILVDSSAGAHTINLITSPVTGTQFIIKDATGNAAANNITISPAAGNIDGSASYVINNNYGSITVIYSGTQWNII